MPAEEEAVVRRFYEEMCNDRKNELAPELFTDDHQFHDPQIPAGAGPDAVAGVISVYQEAVEGHWHVDDIFSAGDKVAVRWRGTGRHVAEVNGIPATGKDVAVEALSIFRLAGGKIAETWEVWDTLTFLQQIGAVPAPG